MKTPFYQLKSKKKMKQYFRKTIPWKRLPEYITDEIVNRLFHDMLAFEVFVGVSIECNLVEGNYISLCGGRGARNRKEENPKATDNTLSMFALTLYNSGGIFRDNFVEMLSDEKTSIDDIQHSNWFEYAKMCYESSVAIEPNMVGALYQLAFIWNLEGEPEKALSFCNEGIRLIESLDAIDEDKLTYYQIGLKDAGLEEIMDNFKEFRLQIAKSDRSQ